DEVAEKVGLPKDGWVSYFHPVEFVGAISPMRRYEFTVDFLETVLGKTGDWFTGVGGDKTFRETLKKVFKSGEMSPIT
ncbi:hypothetical protein QN391_25800, partial [Pseudomonas sp. CCI1.2]|uniref:hypothetical protein n=1 Tax=Pseudomonas sp. CCI1.2 TaxID=3048614 RepID=UPI002B22F1AD